jgi:hypothetical protein
MKFLALCHNGVFIDTIRLADGLYSSQLPRLYPLGTTVEQLETRFKQSGAVILKSFFDNLKKCELIEFEIATVDTKPDKTIHVNAAGGNVEVKQN